MDSISPISRKSSDSFSRFDRFFSFAVIAIVTGWVIGLGILAGIVYVIAHFVSKIW